MSQLGFAGLLMDADTANAQRQFDRETAHLPGTLAEALPCYRGMIERHHAAMLAADIETAMAIREDAHRLAEKLDRDNRGILAGPDVPGSVLECKIAAPPGTAPVWGQAGEFVVTIGTMRVRVEITGMFGIGSTTCLFPNFSAHAVDIDRPFLSETGYRSFMGVSGQLVPGLQPEAFVREAMATHIRKDLRGCLQAIQPPRR